MLVLKLSWYRKWLSFSIYAIKFAVRSKVINMYRLIAVYHLLLISYTVVIFKGSKCVQSLKLCTNKILNFLTGGAG